MYANRDVRAVAPTASTSTDASSNTNAPAAPVPGSLGTMAGTVKAARALKMAGTAITGEGTKMIGWIIEQIAGFFWTSLAILWFAWIFDFPIRVGCGG